VSGPLTLLFWNEIWWDVPQPTAADAEVTTDRSALAQADAVVFHVPTLHRNDVPSKRTGQLWVGWSMESRVMCDLLGDAAFMAVFDLTSTYERSSDVWFPYLSPGPFDPYRPPDPADRRAPVVFVSSNRYDRCGRVRYAADVMKTVRVDSFGAVHHNQNEWLPPEFDRGALYSRYKFTLAFENSIAPDYVTEKFFEPLRAGSVPVYRGTEDVADLAPAEDCYIDARDFSSGRELGRYLDHLDGDDEAYVRYHRWRERGPSPRYLGYLERLRWRWIDRLIDAVSARRPGPAQLAPPT